MTSNEIVQLNAGFPLDQQQAKYLFLSLMTLPRVPAASNWCDALDATSKKWPGVPASPNFAMNINVAGRAVRSLPPDTVILSDGHIRKEPGWRKGVAGNAGFGHRGGIRMDVR